MAAKVEWGDTIILRFTTQMQEEGQWVNVDADSYEAWLETADMEPQQIQELSVVCEDTGKYLVSFYADKTKVESGQAYYIAFYWTKDGNKECQRELVTVVPDVK